MRHTSHWLLAASTIALAALSVPAHAQWAEAWRADGYAMPESVVYDESGGAIFVTNINSPDQSSNGQGYVTKANTDGSIVTEKFTDGLNAPRGIEMANGRLYVAQNGEVLEIDATSGEILERHAVENGLFNDVLALPDGRVLITETMRGAIYAIADGEFREWIADPALTGANGLLLVGDQVLVASIGDISQGFQNIKPANIKTVNLQTLEIGDFGSAEPLGNLDGLSSLADGAVLVSDNFTGDLIKVAPDGSSQTVANAGPGAADQDNVGDVVVVPVIQSNSLVAYSIQ